MNMLRLCIKLQRRAVRLAFQNEIRRFEISMAPACRTTTNCKSADYNTLENTLHDFMQFGEDDPSRHRIAEDTSSFMDVKRDILRDGVGNQLSWNCQLLESQNNSSFTICKRYINSSSNLLKNLQTGHNGEHSNHFFITRKVSLPPLIMCQQIRNVHKYLNSSQYLFSMCNKLDVQPKSTTDAVTSRLASTTTTRDKLRSKVRSKLPELKEEELEESFVRGSGPGGQSTNKTSNCVVLKHLSTGIVVKCHQTRSQSENQRIARLLMKEKLDQHYHGDQSALAQLEQARHRKREEKKRKTRVKLEKLKELRASVEGDNLSTGQLQDPEG